VQRYHIFPTSGGRLSCNLVKVAPQFPPVSVGQVFVAGGLPTITYVPRESLQLEDRVRDYLSERHKILSLSGPTKCGKTVLLKSVLSASSRESVWISGGDIGSIDFFWNGLADVLGVYIEESAGQTRSSVSGTGGALGAKVTPFGLGVEAGVNSRQDLTEIEEASRSRSRSAVMAVKEALSKDPPVLVIDDFHYIDTPVQGQIIRGIKDLVFDGLPVVIASVPHRAFDAVRVEKEMTGRVEQLPIDFWSADELKRIPREGFDALNLVDENETIARRLAEESFSSPHLMQDFCLQLCKANAIAQTADLPTRLSPPEWESFFRDRASNTSKAAFDLLARGPRQRTDRIPRQVRGGRITDIYGAVLIAIAETVPLTKLTYEELRASLRDVMAEDPPQRHEVTRVLEEMSKIAREQIEGEPVVDYDSDFATLHISDPFFAYYLRWGVRANKT
jgi:hypothetical protein